MVSCLTKRKQRRAQHVDAARQLDRFAGLSLGVSSDEDEPELQQESITAFGMAENSPHPASLLLATDAEYPPASRSPSPFVDENASAAKNRKRRRKRGKKKPSDWANKCMYAELLEMREDTLYTNSWDNIGQAPLHDGIPDDLETAWVGLGPLPVGKRCLAVTMQGTSINWKGLCAYERELLFNVLTVHCRIEYHSTITFDGESSITSVSITFTSEHDSGLHLRRKLESEWNFACFRCYQMEKPRC